MSSSSFKHIGKTLINPLPHNPVKITRQAINDVKGDWNLFRGVQPAPDTTLSDSLRRQRAAVAISNNRRLNRSFVNTPQSSLFGADPLY